MAASVILRADLGGIVALVCDRVICRLLGSPIPLDKHPGGLLPGKHGTYTYEYQDELSKIVRLRLVSCKSCCRGFQPRLGQSLQSLFQTFLVATLMPCSENDPNCNMKKKLIGNNFVSIVFNESGAPFRLGSVCGQFAHVAIEVGGFRVFVCYDGYHCRLSGHTV